MKTVVFVPSDAEIIRDGSVHTPQIKQVLEWSDLPDMSQGRIVRSTLEACVMALIKDEKRIEAVKLIRGYVGGAFPDSPMLGARETKDFVDSLASKVE